MAWTRATTPRTTRCINLTTGDVLPPNTVYVYLDDPENSFDHAIPHPREISIHMAESGFDRVVVVDEDVRRQFVRMRQPLAPPSAAT